MTDEVTQKPVIVGNGCQKITTQQVDIFEELEQIKHQIESLLFVLTTDETLNTLGG